MEIDRRDVLKAGALAAVALVAGVVKPRSGMAQPTRAWNESAFSSKSLDEVVKALRGERPAQTTQIAWGVTPEIAENGAVVPISITSSIPKTELIAIVVEKNPNPLAAYFELPPGTDPAIVTRVKMGQTSNVFAVVRADGKYFVASREIKVTLGGCGG